MLRSIADLVKHYHLDATDGAMGAVKDILFDDQTWDLRYLVADTQRWLPGRKVLVPPHVVQEPDWARRRFPVTLTRDEVKACPPLDEDQPVSRRHELALYRHYRWNPYWTGPGVVYPPHPPDAVPDGKPVEAHLEEGDAHLRSANEVIGYHVEAIDGEIGHVEDFVASSTDWRVRWIVVDTRNWLPGRKVLVAPAWMKEIRWSDRHMVIETSRERIKNGPEYDPDQPVNHELEERLYDYYGRPASLP